MKGNYDIEVKDGVLRLRTPSFRAGDFSMLHSGIFTPELTSSLAAAAVMVVLLMAAMIAGLRVTAAYMLLAAALFAALFLAFRRYVFFEESLEAVIDRASGTICVEIRKLFGFKRSYGMDDLSEVRQGKVVITPKNPDGVEFVEKIAIQHGTVIPGFGEEKRFSTVELVFRDGTEVRVFSSEDDEEARALAERLRQFVGGDIAKED